jgi:hypothetical protein
MSRALEDIKMKTGSYPDSIKGVDGSSYTKESYSIEIASRAFYTKTSAGYILVSGAPEAVLTDQDGWIRHIISFKPMYEGAGLNR